MSLQNWHYGFINSSNTNTYNSRRIARRLRELLLWLTGFGAGQGFEVQVLLGTFFLANTDADQVFALEVAAKDFLAERVFHVLLDRRDAGDARLKTVLVPLSIRKSLASWVSSIFRP